MKLHRESKKQDTKLLPVTSVKRFSKFFLSLTDSVVNLQQNNIEVFQRTAAMSLHYVVKYMCSKNRHAQEVIEANCHLTHSHSKKLF